MTEQTLYSKDEFKQRFLNIDFDNILNQEDNKLVNSSEYYLQYKNNYINFTNQNYITYCKLLDNYLQLSNNYTVSNSKYIYTVIDQSLYQKLNKDIKNLINTQKKLYDNFIHYINLLNYSH